MRTFLAGTPGASLTEMLSFINQRTRKRGLAHIIVAEVRDERVMATINGETVPYYVELGVIENAGDNLENAQAFTERPDIQERLRQILTLQFEVEKEMALALNIDEVTTPDAIAMDYVRVIRTATLK